MGELAYPCSRMQVVTAYSLASPVIMFIVSTHDLPPLRVSLLYCSNSESLQVYAVLAPTAANWKETITTTFLNYMWICFFKKKKNGKRKKKPLGESFPCLCDQVLTCMWTFLSMMLGRRPGFSCQSWRRMTLTVSTSAISSPVLMAPVPAPSTSWWR